MNQKMKRLFALIFIAALGLAGTPQRAAVVAFQPMKILPVAIIGVSSTAPVSQSDSVGLPHVGHLSTEVALEAELMDVINSQV